MSQLVGAVRRKALRAVIQALRPRQRLGLVTEVYDLIAQASDGKLIQELREACASRLFQGVQGGDDPLEMWRTRKRAYDRYIQRFAVESSAEIARIHGLLELLELTRHVPGDIVECGVGQGRSLTILVYGTAILDLDRRVYGFDSFEGFPSATKRDLGSRISSLGVPGGWTKTSPDLIRDIITVDSSREDSVLRRRPVRLELVRGFFSDTLPSGVPGKIALLHVDCDLYESTKLVLETCLPHVSPGGIVVLDEYDDPHWPGATSAVNEVCATRGLQLSYFPLLERFGLQL